MAYTEPGETRGKVLAFVRERLGAGSPPSVREVQEAFGFRSVQSAREHLEALVAEGHLTKEPHKARAYRLARVRPGAGRGGAAAAADVHAIPILGRVAAGRLTTAVEDIQGTVNVASRTPADRLFALRVKGDSMKDAGILAGDVVIVRRQPDAVTGDIVVALVGDEATVKTLHADGPRIELRPANPAYDPIVPDPADADSFAILGKVVEVRRCYEGSPA
jgi:repressor LexA